MKNTNKWAALLTVSPFVGLTLVLTTYAVVAYLIPDPENVTGQLADVVLGFFGILCILGMLSATPYGLYLFSKSKMKPDGLYDLEKTSRNVTFAIKASLVVQSVSLFYAVLASQTLDVVSTPLLVLSLLLIMASWFGYLVWVFQITHNLRLSGKNTKFDPAFSVIIHFIPLVNFVVPIIMMHDISKQSAPTKISELYWIIIAWWTSYILPILINYMAMFWLDPNLTNIISMCLRLLSFTLLIPIIATITKNCKSFVRA